MTKMDNEKFGNLIRRLRKEKNMTQKELAERLFVSDKTVSKWERGCRHAGHHSASAFWQKPWA